MAKRSTRIYRMLQVPSSLGGLVVSVLGLTNAGKMSPTHSRRTRGQYGSTRGFIFYTPNNFWNCL